MAKAACENCIYWGDANDGVFAVDIVGTPVRECRKAVMFWDVNGRVKMGPVFGTLFECLLAGFASPLASKGLDL